MRPSVANRWVGAVIGLLISAGVSQAAWNNVFQVCCNSCRSSTSNASPVVAAAPSCAPQPQQQCTTRYVQRSYYQPVTTYKTSYYYEPVTTYKTSYYYEPVTSYRYSSYYDPCSCSCQQVATPVTSYRLRSQCSPVTSYLQRTAVTPVTSQVEVQYLEPQTSCCQTTIGAPIYGAAPQAGGYQAAPQMGEGYAAPTQAPAVSAGPIPADNPPGVSASEKPNMSRLKPMPQIDSNSYRQPDLTAPVVKPTSPPANVRIDRIVSLSDANLSGQVVNQGRVQAGARILLVSLDKAATQKAVTADDRGQFKVTLASGNWLVYVNGADGKPVFQDKVEVRDDAKRTLTLVSR